MPIQHMENVGIVVEDLGAVTNFFLELGLKVQGEATVEGDWVDRCVGLDNVRCKVAVMETKDGRAAVELMQFVSPSARGDNKPAPPNTYGMRRIAFAVDDVDAEVAGLHSRGRELLGEVVNYEDIYKLCYVRGPEGIIVMLAEKLG